MAPPKTPKSKLSQPRQRKGRSTRGEGKQSRKRPIEDPPSILQRVIASTPAQALQNTVPLHTTGFLMTYLDDNGELKNVVSSESINQVAEVGLTPEFSEQLKQAILIHRQSRYPGKIWQIQISEKPKLPHPQAASASLASTGFRISPSLEDCSTEEVEEAEETEEADPLDSFAPAIEERRCLRIGNRKEVVEFYTANFIKLKQLRCKAIIKEWIKVIEPGKQAKNPYNGGREAAEAGIKGTPAANELKKPGWWAGDCEHKEPDHLKKPYRLRVLVQILRWSSREWIPDGQPFTVAMLEESTASTKMTPEARTLLKEIYRVRRKEEKYERDEIDGSHEIFVTPFSASDPEKINAFDAILSKISEPSELSDQSNIQMTPRKRQRPHLPLKTDFPCTIKRQRTWTETSPLKIEDVAATPFTPLLATISPESPEELLDPLRKLGMTTELTKNSGTISTGPRDPRCRMLPTNFEVDRENCGLDNRSSLEPLSSTSAKDIIKEYGDQPHLEHSHSSSAESLQAVYTERSLLEHRHPSPQSHSQTRHINQSRYKQPDPSPAVYLHTSYKDQSVGRSISQISNGPSQCIQLDLNNSRYDFTYPRSTHVPLMPPQSEQNLCHIYRNPVPLEQSPTAQSPYTYASIFSPADFTPAKDLSVPLNSSFARPHQLSAYQGEGMINHMSGSMMRANESGYNTYSAIPQDIERHEQLYTAQQGYQLRNLTVQTTETEPETLNSSIYQHWGQITTSPDASVADRFSCQLEDGLSPTEYFNDEQGMCNSSVDQSVRQQERLLPIVNYSYPTNEQVLEPSGVGRFSQQMGNQLRVAHYVASEQTLGGPTLNQHTLPSGSRVTMANYNREENGAPTSAHLYDSSHNISLSQTFPTLSTPETFYPP